MIVTMFDNAYEQAVRLANNNSISVQRMATVENQIKEMEERLQDAISHQVAALREAALEQNVELNEALSNGEVTIDDIDLDIRSGLTPGSIGVSFYGTETEEGSEAQIYTELVNDLQERLKTLQQERQTIEEEQGVLAIMKKNFEYFLACLKELPDTNAGGMPLRVNGLDEPKVIRLDSGEGVPVQSNIDGAKYAAFIDESVAFATQKMRGRGNALSEMVMEKLKAVDGKCLIECASEEFISFIEDAYRCLKSR